MSANVPKRPWWRNPRILLALIVLSGMALRLALAALPRVARWDEVAYLMIARNLLAGVGYREMLGAPELQQPPMVAMLSLPGTLLRLPPQWSAGLTIHVLLGGLIPLPLYGLASRLYTRQVGLLAALLAAIYPALVASPLYWSTMTETPYALFVLTGVYATWRLARAGLDTAGAYSTRVRAGVEPSGGEDRLKPRLQDATTSPGGQAAGGEPSGGGDRLKPRLRGRGGAGGGAAGWAVVMGFSFGLAYLTRPEALVYLALMLFFVVVYRLSVDRRSLAKLLAPAAASILVCGLVALPYVLYLHNATGRWLISGKQGVSIDIAWAFVNNDEAGHDRAAASLDSTGKEINWLSTEQLDRSLAAWIAQDPGRFIWQVRRNVAATWQALFHEDLLGPWTLILAGLGLFSAAWTSERTRRQFLLLLALAPMATTWVFFVLSRFLVVAVPIVLIWAAAGLARLISWGGATAAKLALGGAEGGGENGVPGGSPAASRSFLVDLGRALPVAATVAVLLIGGFHVVEQESPRQPFWRVEAATWLAQHLPAGSPIMTRDTEFAYYAGLPMVTLPNADWPPAQAYGLARGARYLVIEDKEIEFYRPQLQALLDPANSNPLPGLAEVARLPLAGRTVLVFELKPMP